MLFQEMVRLDNDHGSGGFESYTAFDADDGISHMDIPSYTVWLGDGLQMLDGFYRIAVFLSVDGDQLSLIEFQDQVPDPGGSHLGWPGFLRKIVLGGEGFLASHRCSPK